MPLYIDNLQFDETSTDPSPPSEGQIWYNTVEHRIKTFSNGEVKTLAYVGDAVEAASVTTDTTDFDGILSPADDTVQKALDTIDNRIYTQETAPASPVNGTLWYNTAAGWNSLMAYDASRSKWLSTTEWTMTWGHDTADGELVRGFGINVAATGTGALIPRNACLKRISVRSISDNIAKRLDVLVNGTSVMNFNLVGGPNDSTYINNAVNLDLAEGDNIWIYVDSALLGLDELAICFWCSWRV